MGGHDPFFHHAGEPVGNASPRRPIVRFSAIGEAWRWFSAQPITWILAGVLVLIGNWGIEFIIHALFQVRPHVGPVGFRVPLPPRGHALHFVLLVVLNGFFLGGMFRMATLQLRGKRIEFTDLFDVSHVLTELAVGSALYGLIVFAAGLVCFVIPAFIAAGVLMFTIPLIVDARLSGPEALRRSWDTLKGEWLGATLFHTLVNMIAGIGVLFCCVGLPFTMPLYCLSISVLYRDAFHAKGIRGNEKPGGLDDMA